MESASRSSGMSLPEKLRPKQREIIEAFDTRNEVIAKLPTGYGKTLAAAGAYATLRHRGACNRMLYIVARSVQGRQAAESVPDELALFKVASQAIEVSRTPMQALLKHRHGSIEVFVTTVQALQPSAQGGLTVCDLMQTGRWFVVIEEHHHYGNEGAWTDRIKALPHCALLAMSATPKRLDETDHFGEPQIVETYRAAAKAGYVKQLRLHAYEYIVDAITEDEREIAFTTEQIVRDAGSDPEAIDRHMVARKMRWSPKYVSPLITYPLDRLIDMRTRGFRAQMLIQAMCCTHAEMVFNQVRALVPDNISVDWVGTGTSGRSDDENKAALLKFCPPKDKATGRRSHSLDVLINVGMAGEGLDTTNVTEIVFLTPANITITNLQMIGRGARVIAGMQEQPKCHINVDTGSEMAPLVGEGIMDIFDDLQSHKPEEDADNEDDHDNDDDGERPLPEKMSVVLLNVRLKDIRTGELFLVALEGARLRSPTATREDLEQAAETALLRHLNRANNISSALAQQRDSVNHASAKIAGHVIRRLIKSGRRVEKSEPGSIRRRINSQKKKLFGCVEDATEEQLLAHWQWLRELEKAVLTAPGLQGIPPWLR
jgi:superfamily II DNA or RNA helicase